MKRLQGEKQVQVQLKSEALFLVTPTGGKSGSPFLPAPDSALLQADRCSPSDRAVSLLCCCSLSLVQQGTARQQIQSVNRVLNPMSTPCLPLGAFPHFQQIPLFQGHLQGDWQHWHLPGGVEPADIPKTGISTPHQLSNNTRLWGKENRFSASCHIQDTACNVLDTAQEIQWPFTLQFY